MALPYKTVTEIISKLKTKIDSAGNLTFSHDLFIFFHHPKIFESLTPLLNKKTLFSINQHKFHLTFFNSTVLPFSNMTVQNKLRSIKRAFDHAERFGNPLTSATLRIPLHMRQVKNKRIYHSLLNIAGDDKGPYVIPRIIDHWTTFQNFQSIVKSGAIYGNATLSRNSIRFSKNALSDYDKLNLDGNVICFSPGGFVDSIVIKRDFENRMRIRIDLAKVGNLGRYNMFFKAVDFGTPCHIMSIQVTKSLRISIAKHPTNLNYNDILAESDRKKAKMAQYTYRFHLSADNFSTSNSQGIHLTESDLIFYGNLEGINRFCLLLPFLALEKIEDKNFVQAVYQELNTLNDSGLKKALIILAQYSTLFSEYNFNGILPLTSNLIYDINFKGITYDFSQFSAENYAEELKHFTENNLKNIPQSQEILITNHKDEICLYGKQINGFDSRAYNINVREVDKKEKLQTGYVETRPGNRRVEPSKNYFSIYQAKKNNTPDEKKDQKKSLALTKTSPSKRLWESGTNFLLK